MPERRGGEGGGRCPREGCGSLSRWKICILENSDGFGQGPEPEIPAARNDFSRPGPARARLFPARPITTPPCCGFCSPPRSSFASGPFRCYYRWPSPSLPLAAAALDTQRSGGRGDQKDTLPGGVIKSQKIRLFCDLKKRDRKYNDSEQFSWRNLISFSLNVIFHCVSYLAGLFLPLSPNSVDKQLIPVSHRDENISAKLKVIFTDSMCIWLFIAELLAALLSVCLHVSAGLSRHLGNKVAKQNMMVLNTNRHDLASLKTHVKPNFCRHFTE